MIVYLSRYIKKVKKFLMTTIKKITYSIDSLLSLYEDFPIPDFPPDIEPVYIQKQQEPIGKYIILPDFVFQFVKKEVEYQKAAVNEPKQDLKPKQNSRENRQKAASFHPQTIHWLRFFVGRGCEVHASWWRLRQRR